MKLSIEDAAKILNVSKSTIYHWIEKDIIPFHRINEQYKFNQSELLDWATLRRIPVSAALFDEPQCTEFSRGSLSRMLKTGGVTYDVQGQDKPSVLRSIVDVLKLPEDVDSEFMYQILMSRETLGSTGIGDGIAIPHVRNPVVLHVTKPGLVLCFLKTPIDFNAIDGKPVNTLFTIISPTINVHLQILARLGHVLKNIEFKAALKQQASPECLFETLSTAEAELPLMNVNVNLNKP